MIDETRPTHALPKINEWTFAQVLTSANSPAQYDVYRYWPLFLEYGVDPSFALGQFWAESLYGTSGWATRTGSWGNILFPNTQISESTEYHASNGYHYAKYTDWYNAVKDYVLLLGQYRDHPDKQHGDTSKIYWATAKWIGKDPGSQAHLEYLSVLFWRMGQYENPNTPTQGEDMLQIPDKPKKYTLKTGTPLYDVPGGKSYDTYIGKNTAVAFIGRHPNTGYGMIQIKTTHGSPEAHVAHLAGVYVADVREGDLV